MTLDFNVTEPTWYSTKFNISTGPVQVYIDKIKNAVTAANALTTGLNNAKQDMLSQVISEYKDIKASKTAVFNSAIEAINQFSEDFNDAGAKFILLRPFVGDLTDLRSTMMRALSTRFENFPHLGPDASGGAFTLIFTTDQVTLVDTMTLIAKLTYLFFNKNNPSALDFVKEMIDNPMGSIIGQVASSDLIEQIKKSVEDEIGDITDIGQAFGNLPNAVTESFTNQWDASPIASLVDDVLNPTATDTSVGKLTDFFKTPTNLIPSDGINPYAEYKVIQEYPPLEIQSEFPNDYYSVLYNNHTYLGGDKFIGISGFDTYIGTEHGKGRGHIQQTGKIGNVWDAMGKFYVSDAAGNQQLVNDIENLNPFDKWYNITTVGDLFGKPLHDATKFGTNLLKEVGMGFDSLGDLGVNALGWASRYTDLVGDGLTNVFARVNSILDSIPQEVNALNISLLYTGILDGGMDQIRFAHDQWIRPYIPNIPVINENTFMMVMCVVFSDGGVVNKVSDFFEPRV